MRILHLPGRAVWGYSEKEIEDILEYFKPDISLTTQMKWKLKRKVESVSKYETIHMDSVDGYKERNLDDEILVILRDSDAAPKLDFNGYRGKRKLVITDLIREQMDTSSFDFSLANASIVDELKGEDDLHILSTEIEAGKKPEHGGHRIYGFGLSSGLGDDKIPNLVTGKRPHIEFLDSKKVGLAAIPGLGGKFSTKLENMGISTRDDLSGLNPREILDYEGIGPYRSTKWVCSARSLEEESVFRIKENDLKGRHRLFIDIETDSLQPNIIWHIGLSDDRDGEYHSFLEKDPDKKGRIIRHFMDYLEEEIGEDTCLLAWYGKKFDFEHLGEFIGRYDPDRKHIWEEVEKIDFMEWSDKHAALPCRSSKLYDVSSRLGYESSLLGLDGGDVGRIYSRYMTDRDLEPDWEELKTYAKDDVMSMKYIYDEIKKGPILHDIDEIKKEYGERY
ncbi:MAG: ribonuclease H-like domain-containing protein [Candidatus Thermoplasmatota archaeon]|nr:ribonuclease H-like domain-containing protein [Candidatus Thermoplasmatota archaeon]